MKQGIQRVQRRIAEVEAFNATSVLRRWDPRVQTLQTAIEGTLAAVFGHGTLDYERYKDAASLDDGPVTLSPYGDASPFQAYLTEGKEKSRALLKQAVRDLEERIEYSEPTAQPNPTNEPERQKPYSRKVFIVHGRDDGPREAVARFLERLGFQPIILHEQASRNMTVIEKVEKHSEVGFAVVLLTPDDEGNLKGEPPQPRARQNVMLELGYFIGKLGRERVCAIQAGELEIPSDWRGVVVERYDASSGWKLKLAKELEAAGYEIDWQRFGMM